MLRQLLPNRQRSRPLLYILLACHAIISIYTHPSHTAEPSTAQPRLLNDEFNIHEKRQDNTTSSEPLPNHFWKLADRREDVEAFRQRHNLTLVDSSPQDAALMPSWPQALVQYILIAPPINCWYSDHRTHSTTHTRSTSYSTSVNGITTSSHTNDYSNTHSYTRGSRITPFNFLQVVLSPFIFIAWTVSFGTSQSQKDSAGWLSVMGWTLWFDMAHLLIGPFALPPLFFQWAGSLAVIIQRWTSGFGDVAYRIENLNGCVPFDGLAYLQQGARSRNFRVFQAVTFPVATLFTILSIANPDNFNSYIAMPAFAELVYTAYIAGKGTPMVVSGNCLLVELNPSRGFLDSNISTRWKAFSSFMGF